MKVKFYITVLMSLFILKAGATIELVSFTGAEGEGYIELNWQTRTEHDLRILTLEKSLNAIDFIALADFHSDGLSVNVKDYNFHDESPAKGITYYRLKQTDRWGNIKYFKIIAVNYTKDSQALIFPNPVSNRQITFRLNSESETYLTISNSNARTVYTSQFPADKNKSLLTIELPMLDPGAYVFTIQSTISVSSQRMFITD